MATVAVGRRSSAIAIVALVAASILLNYSTAARSESPPADEVRTGSLGRGYGFVFSAFFWIYAPVQLFAGWLCDRFSVYRLIALGIFLWAASTLLTGLVTSFVVLLALRLMLGIGESISFPGSSKIIARHVPAERRGMANAMVAAGIAWVPAIGTLVGGTILAGWGWRAMFFASAATLLWLFPWLRIVPGLEQTGDESRRRAPVPARKLLRKWPLWAMSIGHCAGNYCFYFLLAWLPLFLVKSRGYSIPQMTALATLGYVVQGSPPLFTAIFPIGGLAPAAPRH